MNIMTFILTVIMIWIVLIFLVLPFALQMPKKIIIGNADSAPEKHYLMQKIFITLFISIVIAIIYWYIVYYKQ